LGYKKPFGYWGRYFIDSGPHPLGCVLFSGAAKALNARERCNLAGRYRWGIESSILVEKHHGYAYEHTFAKDWNAMRGYHYLMRIAHLLNTLARYSTALAGLFQEMGIQAFIRFVRATYTGPWLEDAAAIEQRRRKPFRLRLL